MKMPTPLKNLLNEVKIISKVGTRKHFKLEATIITPMEHIKLKFPSGFARLAFYVSNKSDKTKISGKMEPGKVFKNILPYRDNLRMEVREVYGTSQRIYEFVCVPLIEEDPTEQGGVSHYHNPSSFDDITLMDIEFQLIDKGYSILKNRPVGNNYLMANVGDVIIDTLVEYSKDIDFPAPHNFKGVEIELPVSNTRTHKQVIIPQNVQIKNLVDFLQNDPHYGVYSKGAGQYYSKGRWHVYPMFGLGRYEKAKRVLNVYRIPSDVFPTLDTTYYTNDKVITILGMGEGKHKDLRDVKQQNTGVGKRVVSSDLLSGESGYYYSNGDAMTTRKDSVTEFKLSQRADGKELIPLDLQPTNNTCKPLSEAAMNTGVIVSMEWHSSDSFLLEPAMPVRYFYVKDNVIMIKEGTLLGYTSSYGKINQEPTSVFRENTVLNLFLIDR